MSTENKTNTPEETAAAQPITDEESAGVAGGLFFCSKCGSPKVRGAPTAYMCSDCGYKSF